MDSPFTTDGCSGGMSALWRLACRLGAVAESVPPWEGDCVAHDRAYHAGGGASERVKADAALAAAVAAKGHPLLARFMFVGVGIGGHPWLPLPWRWGYGWKWPRGYRNRD